MIYATNVSRMGKACKTRLEVEKGEGSGSKGTNHPEGKSGTRIYSRTKGNGTAWKGNRSLLLGTPQKHTSWEITNRREYDRKERGWVWGGVSGGECCWVVVWGFLRRPNPWEKNLPKKGDRPGWKANTEAPSEKQGRGQAKKRPKALEKRREGT